MIQVGTSGSWREKGIKASEIFSNQFANRYFREDAYFAIIYVSDEEDQSEKLISNHLEQISKWKKNKNLVKAYSIVDTNSTPKVINGYSYGSQRYQAISNLTGGTISDIKSNFYNSLLNISSEIVELTKSFPLTRLPKSNSSIQVKVDGLLNTSWIYDQQTKTIKFNLGLEPIVSQKIEVIYEVES